VSPLYLKQHQQGQQSFDTNFQGYGRFLTSSNGEYYFRTIKPVPYRGRPAVHIHARIWKGDKKLLTTECFIKGSPRIERDGQFRSIRSRNPRGHETLCVDFAPVKDSRIGELAARWDIALGYSPEA
jgi:protocatechuate 3,4-dioxygenase, beta subunit